MVCVSPMMSFVSPVTKKHGFSPCVKPYFPPGHSPASVPLETGSAQSTPMAVASPALSTPGCNPAAKPFLPASQRLSEGALGGRREEHQAKGAITIQEMLDVGRTITEEPQLGSEPLPFTAAASDLSDILSASAGSSCHSWLSEVCKTLEHNSTMFMLDESDSASTRSHESAEDAARANSMPSAPMTSLNFMKMKKAKKVKSTVTETAA
eukprot:TRINITY_DN11075_c0_g1_i1.p1 TRINITY_DN11075_c0_g1~~TRINITY_DN11075_c0_g1_i1.p1  ORF type:complete len:209 (+),score=78.89 TRINITY_DN11075_c0_g1_i1:73-699(+)